MGWPRCRSGPRPFIQTWNAKTAVGFGLKPVGGCLLIDGSFGSRTAALAADYSDATGSDGVLYVSDEQLTNFLRQANEAGLQTAVHAIGDRAVQQVMRCHEQARRQCRATRCAIGSSTPNCSPRL